MSLSLSENLKQLKAGIRGACKRSGRSPREVGIIWVSKTRGREQIIEALDCGATDFGENRVQETLEKFPLDGHESRYRLHFIGRLQSNKVRKIVPVCTTIHSVDSVDLLNRVERICGEMGVTRDLFLQVNASGESSKTGFEPGSFLETLSRLPRYSHIRLVGLMTIAPFSPDPEESRPWFRGLAELLHETRREFSAKTNAFGELKYLSMGMSDDFEVAIEEGSHYIRIGTKLFGQRAR